jgi:Rod binding domain-containing protein
MTLQTSMSAISGADGARTNASGGADRPRSIESMRETAVALEASFLSHMLKPMFEGIDAEQPFGGGFAEETWRSMQIEEYGKALAGTGGIGLADAILREMVLMQEQATP